MEKALIFPLLPLVTSLAHWNMILLPEWQADQSVSDKEFSASFAVGGKLYAHPDYDPAFRLIVKLDDQYYLARAGRQN